MTLRHFIIAALRIFEKDFSTHNRIEVSQSALIHNIELMARLCSCDVIPVLKGNAYGHGIALVSRALQSQRVPYIAVDGYFEALRVREESRCPVLIMGAIKPSNFARLRYDNFAFVIHDAVTVHALGGTGKKIKIHIECETGMHRYGVRRENIGSLLVVISRYKNLTLEGVMSHLADSDGDDPATVVAATTEFDKCVEAVRMAGFSPTIIHLAQTAGSVVARSKYTTALRLGLGLYGYNPFAVDHPAYAKLTALRPALRLVSTITQISDVQVGDQVGYNYTFTVKTATRIGVLPIGYYEGINRSLSNAGSVQVGSTYAAIVGRVCMNHTMIDLGDSQVQVGDEVVVYSNVPSDKNSIESIAKNHGLFTYQLLTGLSPDVRRVLVE